MGQGTSQIGNWVQLIATSWLVFRLSESTLMVGLSAFTLQIPLLIITPFAGVLIDRLNVRKILFATNALAMAQSIVMLVLLQLHLIEAWHVVIGNLVLGIGNSFDAPARQAMISKLLPDREDLINAIALNSTVMNAGRFIGPMLGGIIAATFGEAWSFATNCVMRFAVLSALFATQIRQYKSDHSTAGMYQQFIAGFRYAYGFFPSRSALFLLAVTSFCLQSYNSLLPWFASQQFHGDSKTLGWLYSSAGLGAVFGMLYLASRSQVRGLFRVLGWTAGIGSVALIAFSFCDSLWLAMPVLFISALCMMLNAASTNTVLQSIVPDELRGRVSALYVMAFLGMTPLGSLFSGWLAHYLDGQLALAFCAFVGLCASIIYSRYLPRIRQDVLPLYKDLKIT